MRWLLGLVIRMLIKAPVFFTYLNLVPSSGFWIQLLANVYLGWQQGVLQVIGSSATHVGDLNWFLSSWIYSSPRPNLDHFESKLMIVLSISPSRVNLFQIVKHKYLLIKLWWSLLYCPLIFLSSWKQLRIFKIYIMCLSVSKILVRYKPLHVISTFWFTSTVTSCVAIFFQICSMSYSSPILFNIIRV